MPFHRGIQVIHSALCGFAARFTFSGRHFAVLPGSKGGRFFINIGPVGPEHKYGYDQINHAETKGNAQRKGNRIQLDIFITGQIEETVFIIFFISPVILLSVDRERIKHEGIFSSGRQPGILRCFAGKVRVAGIFDLSVPQRLDQTQVPFRSDHLYKIGKIIFIR